MRQELADRAAEIKKLIPLEDYLRNERKLQLKPDGSGFKVLCPFHPEKTPSLQVDAAPGTFWFCHGCRKSGDVITWVREADNVSFAEAIDTLSALAGLQPLNLNDNDRRLYEEKVRHHNVLHKVNSAFLDYALKEAGKHLPEFKAYWEGVRGLTLEVARAYKVGYVDTDVMTVRRELIDRGCTVGEIDESGLLLDERMFRKRIVIGVINHKQVRFIYGRSTDDSDPHHLYQKNSDKTIFNLDRTASGSRIIAVESILDAIALIQLGFEHEVVGMMGANITEGQLKDLRRTKKKVWFLFDNDIVSKAGLTASIDAGLRLNGHHAIAQFKGRVKDPNDFIKTGGTRVELEQLLEESKGNAAHKLMITSIDATTPRHELPKLLEPVLTYLSKVEDEIASRSMLERDVKDHFKFTAAELNPYKQRLQKLRERYARESEAAERAARSEAPDLPDDVLNIHELHNGVSYVDGSLWYQFVIKKPERVIDPKTHIEKMVKTTQVWYICSDRSTRNRDATKLEDDLIIDSTPVGISAVRDGGAERWQTAKKVKNSVESWRTGTEEVDPKETFFKIRRLLQTYLWFKDEVREQYYDLLTVWTLMTYWSPVFDSIGYLFLHASPRSGKTTTMTLLENLAFEAELMGDVSGSSLFRKIEGSRGAMLLDEMEKLASEEFADSADPINQVLLTGYKSTGNTQRTDLDMKSDTNTGVQTFSTFCPKVIANTRGIKVQTIRDRSIELELLRSDHRLPQFNSRKHEKLGTFEEIRNEIYCIALKYVGDLADIYEERLEQDWNAEFEKRGLFGRDFEVWAAMWSVAYWLDEIQVRPNDPILPKLVDLASKHKIARDTTTAEDSIDAPLLKALRRFVREHAKTIAEIEYKGQKEYYTKQNVIEYLRNYPRLSKISESKLMEIMRRVNVVSSQPAVTTVAKKSVSVIQITQDKVMEAIRRYDVGDDDLLMRDESLEEYGGIEQDETHSALASRF